LNNKSIVDQKAFRFAVRIVNLYRYLSSEKKEYVLSKQLLRSGTSIGANIREALSGQSKKDFIAKLNIALKEASESKYWLELLIETKTIEKDIGNSLHIEADELFKILTSIIKTTKKTLSN
jgi:four helix bundle protein